MRCFAHLVWVTLSGGASFSQSGQTHGCWVTLHTYIELGVGSEMDWMTMRLHRRTYIHTYIHTYLPTYLHTYIHTLNGYVCTYINGYVHTKIDLYICSLYFLMLFSGVWELWKTACCWPAAACCWPAAIHQKHTHMYIHTNRESQIEWIICPICRGNNNYGNYVGFVFHFIFLCTYICTYITVPRTKVLEK